MKRLYFNEYSDVTQEHFKDYDDIKVFNKKRVGIWDTRCLLLVYNKEKYE